MTAPPEFAENLVIGGGPAGSIAALRLAETGRSVLLIEREPAAHHKVCGEFLSREAVDYLSQSGIDPLSLGAVSVRNLHVSSGGKIAGSALPFPALSLSRRILDEALLARAEQAGCRIIRGVSAESLQPFRDHWLSSLSNGATIRANTVFLATGKHNLRGLTRTPAPQSDLIGFKMHWALNPASVASLRETMELFLFSGGYGGLALVEGDIANLCLVVRRSTLRKLGAWPQLLSAILRANPHLRSLLDGGAPLWPRPLAISPIPYGYLARKSIGLWRIGDQAAVIPSFTGDGISIALHSGALAAQMFIAGKSSTDFQSLLSSQLRQSISLATRLSQSALTCAGRTLALPALSRFPHAMRWIASATRIPERSLVCRAW